MLSYEHSARKEGNTMGENEERKVLIKEIERLIKSASLSDLRFIFYFMLAGK